MARLVVEKQALIANYRLLCARAGVPVIPVLKANGYGVGAEAFFTAMQEAGAPLMAVSRLDEAVPLAGRGFEILVLSCGRTEAYAERVLELGVTTAADTLDFARSLSDLAQARGTRARIHIKIDTGMGRFGFLPDQTDEMAAIFDLPGLEVTGIFSHFYASFARDSSASAQLARFREALGELERRGVSLPMRHIANSCAALKSADFALDAVRIGSAITGRVPMHTDLALQKVGRFEGEILSIRTLPAGSNIGYGGVYRLKKETRVAVVAAGTCDGLQRTTEPGLYGLPHICRYLWHDLQLIWKKPVVWGAVNGQRARMISRPATTHSFFDVTNVDCREGDQMELNVLPMMVGAAVERVYE